MRTAEKNRPWFVADFETTGDNEYQITGRTRVWLYAVSDPDGNIVKNGSSIEDFFEWCSEHHGSLIYFHNLKFDGAFILSYLLEKKYPMQDNLTTHSARGFKCLIGDMGEFYSITINFRPNCQVVIYDSLKLIPMPVRTIAEAFGLPETKGKIDYSSYVINEETIDYVNRDVIIVAKAIKYFRDNGYYRMTIASNAYHSYISSTPLTKWWFPKLPKDFIETWRSAYRGGRSQVNPKYAGKIMHDVKRFDINSMYPSIMAKKPLPYGEPIKLDKPGLYDFELYHVHIKFRLKPNHLPTLLKTGSIFAKVGDTYYKDSEGIIDLYISNIDLNIMKKHYYIEHIFYLEIYGFRTRFDMFRDWVNVMYENKSKHTGGLRLVYKLLLNSLYGKFGSRPTGQNKIPNLGADGIVGYSLTEEHDMTIYYLPIAIAITSWAHKMIDDAICQTGYDNFVYCDTDSVHTIGDLPSEMIDQKELGKFKLEAIEPISKYIRQKTYIYREGDEWKIVCSGLSFEVRAYLNEKYGDDLINKFDIGLKINKETEPDINDDMMKLIPKRVPGGVILYPVPFSLL